jgi:hypothetical protein
MASPIVGTIREVAFSPHISKYAQQQIKYHASIDDWEIGHGLCPPYLGLDRFAF